MTEDKSSIEDLFSEEDIPFDIETEALNEPSAPRKKWKGWIPAVVVVIVVTGLFYLAYLNHHKYFISSADEMIKVERGLFFPVGKMLYQPTVAYQPFKLPALGADIPPGALTADHRDQILLVLFLTAATETLEGTTPSSLEEGMSIFRRAYKLETADVSSEQHNEFMGQYNMRKMYSTIGKINSLLNSARANADDANRQGVSSAKEWLAVIEKALKELSALASREEVDLSTFDAPLNAPALPAEAP